MTSDSTHIMTSIRYPSQNLPYRKVTTDGISCQEVRHLRLSPVSASASILLTGIRIQGFVQSFATKVYIIKRQHKKFSLSLAFPGNINNHVALLDGLDGYDRSSRTSTNIVNVIQITLQTRHPLCCSVRIL